MLRKLLSFLLVLFFHFDLTVIAQSPGGVTVKSWYRADAAGTLFSDAGSTVASNNATVYQWNDHTGAGFNFLQTSAGSRPVFSNTTTLANFNPTVTFDGSNDWMQFTAATGVNIIDRANGTLYAAGYMNQLKQSGFLGFHASMDYPGLHFFNDNKLLFFTGGPGYQGVSADVMQAGTYFTSGTGWQNDAGSTTSYAAATVSLNGNRVNYSGSELYNANLSTGARDLRIGADNNWGALSGQLNEILVFEDRLTPLQMDQVETYLALKYGTTYAKGLSDYKNSVGGTVWNATGNNGYHFNIAGIARDDQGALYQKQSWSTNQGNQVLIGIGTLANTNSANAATLSDGQYLVWGDNGLAKVPTVTTSSFAGLSHRFAAIWKVQNTGLIGTVRVAWPQGLTNLSLIQSTDATIDATDIVTNMSANEVTINGVVYNYADVTLSNGQYFTFAAKMAAPGGVTGGLLMWHKADDGTATAGQKNIWKDMSGNGRDVAQNNNATYQPTLITNAAYSANSKNYNFNFNPFYYLDGTNDFFYRLNDSYFPTTTSSGSTYGVMFNSASGGWRTPYGWGDDDPNLNRLDNLYYFIRDNGAALTVDANLTTTPAHIGGMMWRGSTNGLYLNVNGQVTSTTSYNIGNINSATPPNFAIGSEGYNLAGTGNELYQGGISEVFAYNVDHQNSGGDEKQRINSYLAIKYGITLKNDAGTAVPNYLSSASAIVWDATTNTGYNNNIAGLANDDNSALNQKQSCSNSAGQQVLIGTTGLANTNALNATSLNNGQFLVWGDNGLGKVPAIALTGVPGVNFRFASVWKVQNTSGVGTVRVAWPSGLTNLTLAVSGDPTFASVTSSYLMTGNTSVINGVTYNYADVTLSNAQYFTFATQLNGPGGVALNLRVWLRSDAGFDPAQWADLSGNTNNYTQTNNTRQPFIAAKQYNFNPIVDFGTTGADARFMVVPSGKPYSANGTSSTIFTATTSKTSSGGYSDIIGFGATTTGTGLINANSPVLTKQGNNLVLYPYTTAPVLSSVVLNRLYLDDVSYTVGVSGIKYGQNGQTASVAQTFTAGNALFANGSVLGAQPEETNGLIGEVIAYERDLTEAEKQQVRSYVAIKYGITLPHNYIASNSSTIFWDQTTNSGYNSNIAGVVRDDNGSLNQKQSSSINTATEVLISTPGLANDNASNGTMLNDQQFLVWGDNGLAKSPSVAIAGITGVNYRFASIWKVQNTGSVGTVRVAWRKGYATLKLIQSSDASFDAGDVVIDMANIQTVNGVDYSYADVTFADGQYFTFAAFIQAPGGVTNNLSYWYRADKFTSATTAGADVTSWTDFTAGTVSQQLGDNALPVLAEGSSTILNFNPGINFTTVNQSLGNLSVRTFNNTNYDVFVLTEEGVNPGGNGRIFSSLIDNTLLSGSINYWDAFGDMADNRTERMNTTQSYRYLATIGGNRPTTHPGIVYHNLTNTTTGKAINGAAVTTSSAHTAIGSPNGGHAFGSTQFSSNGSDNAGFTGNLGEVVVYGNGNITPPERNKVESYLAIKYGITLNNGNNYTTSQNIVVWDATVNSAYYNNVAGIGNDYLSALEQKQSRSQMPNTNGQVIIGIGDIAVTNAGNNNSLSDGQFLLWGDNGNTQAMTNTAGTYSTLSYAGTSFSRRMNRIWKVQNTGVANDMKIRFPVASVGITTLTTNDACAAYAIIYADDAAFTTNVNVVPLTINGADYETTHSFPNGVSYFTFGKATPISNGVVYLPDVVEATTQTVDNCGINTAWSYFRKSDDATLKLLATSDVVTTPLTVTITPEGTTYDDGTIITKLMPRVSTVTDATSGTYPGVKVRVYYSPDELSATQVPGAITNGWFKYSGDAEAVITDIYSDGKFDSPKAVALTPDATGVEDGVNYVEFHNLTSFSSFVYLSSTRPINQVLPVNLTDFTAKTQGNNVLLNWTTASESNNKGFDVERSSDAVTWSSLGFVASKAINGNSATTLTYDYTDISPLDDRSYYRLKQTDIDDNFKYSKVIAVDLNQSSAVMVLPNPVHNTLMIKGLIGRSTVSVFDLNGRLVKTVQTNQDVLVKIDVSQLQGGMYLVQTEDAAGNKRSYKVIKR